jgi:ribosomal protein S6--L-glutamate ligase
VIVKKLKKITLDRQNIIGWKEWVNLSCLGLPAIKVKIDTGAKTSSLHAFDIESFYIEDIEYVKFYIHPLQKNKAMQKICVAPVFERRMVCDSGGKKEKRFVIKSKLQIGKKELEIEITLANRDSMTFRMLLGRDAIKQAGMMVDTARSFVQGKMKRSKILKLYKKHKL